MQSVRFYENCQERGVELTISNSATMPRLYIDLLVAIDDDRIIIKHPLTKKEYDKYKNQLELIDSILIKHNLISKGECRYHHANLLFFVLEFNLKYKDMLADKAKDARLKNSLEFLKLVKPLSSIQKQQVEMSFVINGIPFTFEDQPILSEIVINKLSGVLMNNICQLYPKLWEENLKRDAKKIPKERSTANSKLQNQAVADIAKLLISYLNSESPTLKNSKAKTDKNTLTSKQGEFILTY
ncbi:hypothetical protein [Mucilaginibacter terrae]|uniref:Uncharacterized protein n=1 Tax=Mucilaginibacter terrae TaxID=1955052 RepID=A0ABU3GVW4_9SPHI|nr:hypothetical protein [Mucilaginibacter terrae]MDT3403611.1 hypothetical protein [Mucilaginibacter terrae]